MHTRQAEDARLVHPWIDVTHAPVYVMRFPAGASDQELASLCETRERWAQHAQHPCAWVADMSLVRSMPPTQRKLFADHLKRFEFHDITVRYVTDDDGRAGLMMFPTAMKDQLAMRRGSL